MSAKKILIVAAFAVFTVAPAVQADLVDFTEVGLPQLTLLDGTAHYTALGLTFTDETFQATDSRFVGAGGDSYGITTSTGSNNFMTVNFVTAATSVDFDWLTVSGASIFAEAFDSGGNSLDTYSAVGLPGPTDTGVGNLTSAGNPIAYVTFNDGTGFMGIGTLEWNPIPAPGAALLGMMGLGLVGWVRRRFA